MHLTLTKVWFSSFQQGGCLRNLDPWPQSSGRHDKIPSTNMLKCHNIYCCQEDWKPEISWKFAFFTVAFHQKLTYCQLSKVCLVSLDSDGGELIILFKYFMASDYHNLGLFCCLYDFSEAIIGHSSLSLKSYLTLHWQNLSLWLFYWVFKAAAMFSTPPKLLPHTQFWSVRFFF